MSQRITIDPVTRIEGHLRIDCEIENGVVSKAWASGTMWRGMEEIVKNRDPRDAWMIVQRICGVCTTTHALSSVRAAESALNIDVPVNAQYIRNIILAAHTTHDHIVHFYQLSALDWVDITSALQADPTKASEMLKGVSTWHLNSPEEFTKVQNKIKDLVASGQLGIFANGYWGHPAMKLPPEVNLIAVAHYLQALECQRDANRVVALLGGKTPHIQNLAVGGVANPINLDGLGVLNLERLMYIKSFIDKLSDFVEQVYKVDTAVIAAFYPEWLTRGKGAVNYLSVPEFPTDSKKEDLALYLKETQGVEINPQSIFDIQIKRLHEYKRQQMNALYLVHKYLEIKKGKKPTTPITALFGAKAAPAYVIAKDIIHMILCLEQIIDNDPDVKPWLQVIMVNNYNVTLAEKLIPACDISEQISLASKEASGTGNMKFMLNGAVTLGTDDGANVEIHELVGDDNIYIFGDSSETVIQRYKDGSYCSRAYYDGNPSIREAVDFITGPQMMAVGSKEHLERLSNELLTKDWFMTFPDFDAYCQAKEQAYNDYEDRTDWARKMLINISQAGFFSSDRTIEEYNRDIWKLD